MLASSVTYINLELIENENNCRYIIKIQLIDLIKQMRQLINFQVTKLLFKLLINLKKDKLVFDKIKLIFDKKNRVKKI